MKFDRKKLESLRDKYGEAFYLLDTEQFRINYLELKHAFLNSYPNFNIAYSYKTNYTPEICKIVNYLGGYAEVVSEMELELALKIGVSYSKIIWNGPIKNSKTLRDFLLSGGTANLDSIEEVYLIKKIALENLSKNLNIGIRCNYDVNDGVISRFGFDIESKEFQEALNMISSLSNVNFNNLHCHFAKRQIEYWPIRVNKMLELIDRIGIIPKKIDFGGGIFGKMDDDLKKQFSYTIPSYYEYAEVIASTFNKFFENKTIKPELIIEPGTAIVGDCMKFVATVKTIKTVRNKTFITVMGSQKNINMVGINPPMKVYASHEGSYYKNADIVGYTCIEGDVLYKNYSGSLAVDDFIVIENCGSYSLVMKPPFILPNFPVIDISGEKDVLIKKAESFNDIFQTYKI